jgi:hypothetical protein
MCVWGASQLCKHDVVMRTQEDERLRLAVVACGGAADGGKAGATSGAVTRAAAFMRGRNPASCRERWNDWLAGASGAAGRGACVLDEIGCAQGG